MSAKPSQKQRILRSLEAAGPRGICQADWDGPNTPDGGPKIPQITRRIGDLRKEHRIDTVGERNGYALYVLRPRLEVLPIVTGDGEPAGLFAPPPVNAIIGLDAA